MTESRQARSPEDGVDVREEDAFDVAAMTAWLAEHGTDVPAGTPQVRQFPGGASNLTYLLSYDDRDLILRRPPSGVKAKSAHDMSREFTIQSKLAPVFALVPGMVAFCDDQDVIGSDFYVMARLEGTILRRDPPEDLTRTPQNARALCLRFLDVLVELHSVDPAAAGLQDLGRGRGYVARQVRGWSDRFRAARTDNVVLAPDAPGRIVGVLDWEMATLGDPLMDLSGALAYWIQADDDPTFRAARRQPSDLPGMMTRAEIVETYAARTGLSVTPEQWRFYEVFGLFRLGVIAQQIYYRYHHGQTTNEAYARFLPMTIYLEERCNRLIDEAAS
jgi:aminoglycoside phosphotransferase (APT) family kinase protein